MTTTIKVSKTVRDRLKAQAARAGTTLGAHLEYLAGLGARAERAAAMDAALSRNPPDDSYHAEAAW